jgi:hypothetical protein
MNARVRTRLLKEARQMLGGYGLDFTQLDAGQVVESEDDVTAEIVFTHRTTGQKVRLSSVWYDELGYILQSGTNCGDLTL